MQITCASCKTLYELTIEQIQGLSYSIIPCKNCSKFIKVTSCPRCGSYYSITFSSPQGSRYRMACEKCSHPLIIDFPLIKEPRQIDEIHKEKSPIKKFAFFKSFATHKNKNDPREETLGSETRPERRRSASSTASTGFTLTNLFNICSSAINIPSLLTSGGAIIIIITLMIGYNVLMSIILESEAMAVSDYMKSILTVIPFAIILFTYIMAASLISRNIMNEIALRPYFKLSKAFRFLIRSLTPVFMANMILFIGIDLLFIVFGKIPVIGPVLFALLFLPIYLTSLFLVIFMAIGFWFYPPIIASSGNDPYSSLRRLARFIKKHNFSLIYFIPLLTVITTLVFFTIYLIHYGSFSLSLFLSRHILGSDGEKIFSSVPQQFLQISDLTLLGSHTGLFKSLIGNILVAHTISGFIIGIIFSMISVFLFAGFISITATLSTHVYLMMERGTDIDDANKTRMLLLVVLILLGMYLIKKIIL